MDTWHLKRLTEMLPFEAVCQSRERTVELFTAKTRVSSVLEMSFILSEASFNPKAGSHDILQAAS